LEDDLATQKSGRVFLDEFCGKHDIALLKCRHINDHELYSSLDFFELDWLFIIGWSQIAGSQILALPKNGVIGAHPTLLPIGRGRASIPWAIVKGLTETGVTLFKMDEGVDTGPIISQSRVPIDAGETATTLYRKIALMHASLVAETFFKLSDETLQILPQDESVATVWPGRKPEDGVIDLDGSVYDAEALVRAVTHPYPGAFFYGNDRKCIVWESRLVDDEFGGEKLIFKDGILGLIDFEYI
jgi:methionyl-tRNA formyltransferase